MNQKELTKIFMMISNMVEDPSVPMVYENISALEGLTDDL